MKVIVFVNYDVDELLSKDSFFLASFELGRTFAVSGDTPTSPAVTLVLFMGPLLCMCLKEEWARSLNAFKSADAFSKYCIRRVHMWQTYVEGESILVTHRNVEQGCNPGRPVILGIVSTKQVITSIGLDCFTT